MKNVIITALMLCFTSLTFGGTYHIELVNGGIEGYKKCDEKIDTDNNSYSLICSEAGLNYNIYQNLETSGLKEFISQTGQVHNIREILKTQETLLQKVNVMVTRLASDMIVFSRIEGGKTIIDIYTGEDASKNEHLINSK